MDLVAGLLPFVIGNRVKELCKFDIPIEHASLCSNTGCILLLVEVKRDVHERYMRHIWRRAEGTVFKDASCAASGSYYIDRHGDASLPLPHTPWWRAIRGRSQVTQSYHFSSEAG